MSDNPLEGLFNGPMETARREKIKAAMIKVDPLPCCATCVSYDYRAWDDRHCFCVKHGIEVKHEMEYRLKCADWQARDSNTP